MDKASPSRHAPIMKAFVGGYMGSSYEVELRAGGTLRHVRYGLHYADPEGTLGHLGEDQLAQRMTALIRVMERIVRQEGKTKFECTGIMDGTNWSVSVSWQGKRLSLSGLNSYPAAWPALRKAVEDLAGGRTWAWDVLPERVARSTAVASAASGARRTGSRRRPRAPRATS